LTTVSLKRVIRIVAEQSPPSDEVTEFEGAGLPFLQGNAEFGPSHPVAKHRCDSAMKRAETGDILLSVRAPVGALNIADRQYGIGRGLAALRPVGVDARFARWSLHAVVNQLRASATGSTFEAITADDVGSPVIPIPAPSDQREIADFLDAETARIDALIEKAADDRPPRGALVRAPVEVAHSSRLHTDSSRSFRPGSNRANG
jgi:type I restriction enzyme S subunit